MLPDYYNYRTLSEVLEEQRDLVTAMGTTILEDRIVSCPWRRTARETTGITAGRESVHFLALCWSTYLFTASTENLTAYFRAAIPAERHYPPLVTQADVERAMSAYDRIGSVRNVFFQQRESRGYVRRFAHASKHPLSLTYFR